MLSAAHGKKYEIPHDYNYNSKYVEKLIIMYDVMCGEQKKPQINRTIKLENPNIFAYFYYPGISR